MKYLVCIYRYCSVRLCEEEIWGLSLSEVLKNDSQRDIKNSRLQFLFFRVL